MGGGVGEDVSDKASLVRGRMSSKPVLLDLFSEQMDKEIFDESDLADNKALELVVSPSSIPHRGLSGGKGAFDKMSKSMGIRPSGSIIVEIEGEQSAEVRNAFSDLQFRRR